MPPNKPSESSRVLQAIAEMREELKEFIRTHDEREREAIRERQSFADRLGHIEKNLNDLDGRDGKIDTLFAKLRSLQGKIIWFTGAGAVVAPIAWLLIQYWLLKHK